MKTITPYTEILTEINYDAIVSFLEAVGRVCYKSEDRITKDGGEAFLRRIRERGHEAILEHYSVSARFVCDRAIANEIVRHRLASYAQESTRYIKYGGEKDIVFIDPCGAFGWDNGGMNHLRWCAAMEDAEAYYNDLIKAGSTPQEARSVLPNSLKTELIMTANIREWRHFFKLRTDKSAHPQMREITIPLLEKFKALMPVLFEDIVVQG
jgi:thymidylate synthase (FAD)